MSRIIDLVIENFSELRPLDFVLIAVIGGLAVFGAVRLAQWASHELRTAQAHAIDTYKGLVAEYREVIEDLRDRNRELIAEREQTRAWLADEQQALASAAEQQQRLLFANFVWMAYIAAQMRVVLSINRMLALAFKMAWAYEGAILTGQIERSDGPDPVALRVELREVERLIQVEVDRVASVMPDPDEPERYKGELLLTDNPFAGSPEEEAERRVTAALDELQLIVGDLPAE